MFGSIIGFVKSLGSVVYYTYYAGIKTGQLIVNVFLALVTSLVLLVNTIACFVVILCESLKIFLDDIYGSLLFTYSYIQLGFEAIFGLITNSLLNIQSAIYGTVSNVGATINCFTSNSLKIVNNIGQLLVSIKQLIILFGSGVWFVITFLPKLLLEIAEVLINLVLKLAVLKDIFHEFKTGLVQTFVQAIQFVIDVPLESLAGLLIALCIGYILYQSYMVFYHFIRERITILISQLKRIIRYFYQCISQRMRPIVYRRNIRQNMLQHRPPIHPNRTAAVRWSPHQTRTRMKEDQQKTNQSVATEQLICVVCQENQRCILILPCRHVCLCSDCSNQMQFYNNICPICRQEIEQTMKIFV